MTKITIERETLLPCPFCGSGASITGTEWGGREQYFVACTGPDCHCAVGENYDRDACPEYSFSSKDDAIAAWNRRAALAAQPAPAAVPPGMALMPIEPTPGIITTGTVALMKASDSDLDATREEIAATYRAMIAAAGDKP